MGVKVRPQITCPYCHYRQNTEEDRATDGGGKEETQNSVQEVWTVPEGCKGGLVALHRPRRSQEGQEDEEQGGRRGRGQED